MTSIKKKQETRVEPGSCVIEAFGEGPEQKIFVYRIDAIEKDATGDFIATVTPLHYFRDGRWIHYESVDNSASAIAG